MFGCIRNTNYITVFVSQNDYVAFVYIKLCVFLFQISFRYCDTPIIVFKASSFISKLHTKIIYTIGFFSLCVLLSEQFSTTPQKTIHSTRDSNRSISYFVLLFNPFLLSLILSHNKTLLKRDKVFFVSSPVNGELNVSKILHEIKYFLSYSLRSFKLNLKIINSKIRVWKKLNPFVMLAWVVNNVNWNIYYVELSKMDFTSYALAVKWIWCREGNLTSTERSHTNNRLFYTRMVKLSMMCQSWKGESSKWRKKIYSLRRQHSTTTTLLSTHSMKSKQTVERLKCRECFPSLFHLINTTDNASTKMIYFTSILLNANISSVHRTEAISVRQLVMTHSVWQVISFENIRNIAYDFRHIPLISRLESFHLAQWRQNIFNLFLHSFHRIFFN